MKFGIDRAVTSPALLLFFFVIFSLKDVNAKRSSKIPPDLNTLEYSVYPRRTEEEAAVLEWGHSAIISALDASVARFGPQTSQAALLEVECMPILANPLNGVSKDVASEEGNEEGSKNPTLQKLRNAEEVHGNIVVMTNNGGLSGVQMARIAKLSGAAALLVVNIDEQRPDDIYRLDVLEGEDADDIDIPVVMISLNSANVLTTATVEANMDPSDVVNHGMPERVRLYAGGDRPFFEDVEPVRPTLYLIHNLLTSQEADDLVKTAKSKVEPLEEGKTDALQLNTQPENYPGVESTMLWHGMLQSPALKAVEERIEQVTGFPSAHFSDFVVDKLEPGAEWKPHYDLHPFYTPMATIIVFLTDNGGPVVYPSARTPIKVTPQKGMAIVHHNTDEHNQMDLNTVHALLPVPAGAGAAYVARKYVFTTPISNARRIALPAFALPFGGKLPSIVTSVHDLMVDQFGMDDGSVYFDKLCVFLPLLLVGLLVQSLVGYIRKQLDGSGEKDTKSREKNSTPATTPRKGKKGKKE
ncbi:PA domain containing protein [Nitzschia inconspicua]|uniref:PA domain containing protein n=1 Tax=Nitzschia inconspicua TaxID=303405 RepID=A0A9K3LH77_9STRA|nr:PA domain containing protein [Nitzschia inconspicua]